MNFCSVGKWFLLVSLFAASSVNVGAVTPEQLECKNPFCDKVAEKIEYGHDVLAGSVNVRTDHFSLDIPDKPIRRIVASGADVIIYYKDNQVLIISESSVPDIDNLADEYAYKLPEIIFTKTSKELESNERPETIFMKVALLQKQFYFSKATEVGYSKNGEIGYFISDSSEMGFSGSAMVSTPRIKKVFLKVDAERMDFSVFKKVVFSVKSGI